MVVCPLPNHDVGYDQMNRVHPSCFYYYYFVNIIIVIIDIVVIIEIIDHLSLYRSDLTNHSLFHNSVPQQVVLGTVTLLLYKISIWFVAFFRNVFFLGYELLLHRVFMFSGALSVYIFGR